MSATIPEDVYADITPAGHTLFRKVPRWRIKIIDGLTIFGPGSDGVIFGWTVVGAKEKAVKVANKHLDEYIARNWPQTSGGFRVYPRRRDES